MMKTVKAVVKDGKIAVAEPIHWPEGTELRVSPASQASGQESLDDVDLAVRHLSAILRDLIELRNGPEQDQHGILRPTKFAFNAASQLLIDAAMTSAAEGRQIPPGCLSTDAEGGVRVEWVRDSASVHLVVPAADHQTAYIYHEAGDRYATEDATAERLADCLRDIA